MGLTSKKRRSARPATDTEVFRAYVGQVLCPILRPGDLVVMDNLSPHQSDPTLELLTAAGAEVLFLPAYSPDRKDVEKSRCTPAQRRSPIPEALVAAIGAAFAQVTATMLSAGSSLAAIDFVEPL